MVLARAIGFREHKLSLNKMPRRKELRNIAYGLASGFSSRNNDIDGYWALGLLSAAAKDAGTNSVLLNLITTETLPNIKFSQELIAPYNRYLYLQLKKKGFYGYRVSQARVELSFNLEPTEKELIFQQQNGNPFTCRATIIDDLLNYHIYEVRSCCYPHDPKRERRSIRRSTYNYAL